jgi:antitoxin component YwqK of YwqJK toxin-antitoxin module
MAAKKRLAIKRRAKKHPVKKRKSKSPARSARADACLHFHADGSLWAKGQIKDGVMSGYWEWFRKDGSRMRSGTFTGGLQTGDWTTYDRKGRVVKVTKMKPK